jgi:hypothetical protein
MGDEDCRSSRIGDHVAPELGITQLRNWGSRSSGIGDRAAPELGITQLRNWGSRSSGIGDRAAPELGIAQLRIWGSRSSGLEDRSIKQPQKRQTNINKNTPNTQINHNNISMSKGTSTKTHKCHGWATNHL